MKSGTILIATNAMESHPWENLTAAYVAHAAERRTAFKNLEASNRNQAVQRARALRAEKASAVLRKRMKKTMAEKDQLTALCD